MDTRGSDRVAVVSNNITACSASEAVDGSSTGIAMFHSAVLKMSVVGTKQTIDAVRNNVRFRGQSRHSPQRFQRQQWCQIAQIVRGLQICRGGTMTIALA